MCTICALTRTFDPDRHTDGPAFATISEDSGDAADGIGTTYSMAAGDTFLGEISTAYEDDWIAIDLVAGESYVIDQLGSVTGGGTLSDPYLRLFDTNGLQIAANDDGGVGFNARIAFTATQTGTYFIEASAYSSRTGTYTVEVTADDPAAPAALDDLALFLTEGYWGGREITWNTGASNVITVNLGALTAAGQQLARWAMEAWEMVVDLDFVEVSTGEMITMDDNSSGAWAYAPGGASNSGVEMNVSTAWLAAYGTTLDSYPFQTYIHEIGHAIGLGHQGDYNGSAAYGNDNTFANDSWQVSVMSYFSQTENTSINASRAGVITAQMADILAVQNLYGAAGAGSATAGDTIWGRGSNLGNYLDAYFAGVASGNRNASIDGGGAVTFTIFDRDGTDLLDLGFSNADARFDMGDETFSDALGLIGNIGIARGTVLENLILGNGNNTVTGNAAANAITTGTGSDTIEGGAGNDTISTGGQSDTIRGGAGNDVVDAGGGRDTVWLEAGNDRFIDSAQNDQWGRDLVYGGTGDDTLEGAGGDDRLYGEDGFDSLIGGLGNDSIFGGRQGDTIEAGDGNDVVIGGNGADIAFLGVGADRFIDELQNDIYGRDTVYAGAGDDTIDGSGGDDLYFGEDGSDVIAGGAGNDRLFGGNQHDTIDAGSGADLVYGGNGRDVVDLGAGDDRFFDSPQGDAFGSDTITGGTGADSFIFGAGIGSDVITDFETGTDRLEFSSALWSGSRSAADIVSDFARLGGADVIFEFNAANIVTLVGLGSMSGLSDDITII